MLAGHGAGQPADQRGAQVADDVGRELAQSLDAGAHQVAHEADRVADDGAEGAGRPPQVGHDAGRDNVEDDFEQAHHLLPGPAEEAAGEVAEDAGDAGEGLHRRQQVADAEAAQRVEEQARQGGGEADQPGQRALEPRPGARHGAALLQVLPDLLLTDQAHEAADQRFGGARYRVAGNRIAPEHGTEQIPAARALRQPGQRPQDGVADELQDAGDQRADEAGDAGDRFGDDAPGPFPDVAEVEDVGPAQGIEEAVDRLADAAGDQPETIELLLHPAGDAVDDAVIVERLRDQGAARHQLDDGAQKVARGAVDRTHVDRIDAEHQREHPETGQMVGMLGEVVERVADAQALHRWRAELGDLGGGAALQRRRLPRGALLDGVGQFMGEQFAAFAGFRAELPGGEMNLVADREGARLQLLVQLRGAGVGMDAHGAEIGAEARLHELPQLGRQRLAARCRLGWYR